MKNYIIKISSFIFPIFFDFSIISWFVYGALLFCNAPSHMALKAAKARQHRQPSRDLASRGARTTSRRRDLAEPLHSFQFSMALRATRRA